MSLKVVQVKHKITHDFLLDIYNKAKTEKNEDKQKELMAQFEFLRKHIGEYLVSPN